MLFLEFVTATNEGCARIRLRQRIAVGDQSFNILKEKSLGRNNYNNNKNNNIISNVIYKDNTAPKDGPQGFRTATELFNSPENVIQRMEKVESGLSGCMKSISSIEKNQNQIFEMLKDIKNSLPRRSAFTEEDDEDEERVSKKSKNK